MASPSIAADSGDGSTTGIAQDGIPIRALIGHHMRHPPSLMRHQFLWILRPRVERIAVKAPAACSSAVAVLVFRPTSNERSSHP
jgi:hypothetical protein